VTSHTFGVEDSSADSACISHVTDSTPRFLESLQVMGRPGFVEVGVETPQVDDLAHLALAQRPHQVQIVAGFVASIVHASSPFNRAGSSTSGVRDGEDPLPVGAPESSADVSTDSGRVGEDHPCNRCRRSPRPRPAR